jgi:fructuronate reductase
VHEPFRQWVIEDDFVAGARPPWEAGGAQFVRDVEPFEHMKLRLLNGAHSALAYLGYLAGHETIADAMADPVFAQFVERLWQEEIVPVVPPPPETDLLAYVAALHARFSNPAIRHRTWQIAMDGSQKLPQRLLGTVRERLARDLPITALALVIAGWARYVGGIDETGGKIDVRDPMADSLAGLDLHGILTQRRIFGEDLSADARFLAAVDKAYSGLLNAGTKKTVARYNAAFAP